MNAEEKMAQLEKQGAASTTTDDIDDLVYLYPAPIKFMIGNKEYKLSAFPIRKIHLLLSANKAFEQIDSTVEWLSETLNETDKEFLEENVNTELLGSLIEQVNKINLPPPSSVQNESEQKSFGIGFRWNVFVMMRDLHMSFEDVSYLTLPQLVILRQCMREVEDAQETEMNKLKAQQRLAAQFSRR